jgi:hypothetical protein
MSSLPYSERHSALCRVIDDLPDEVYASGSDVFAAYGQPTIRDLRSFKLDTFLASTRSRKGKEVERAGES